MPGTEGTISGVFALVGTLTGAAAAHLFQRRAAGQALRSGREEWLRRQRLEAYSAFAGTVLSFRRAQHRRARERLRGTPEAESAAVADESRHLRAAAWESYYRLRMLARSPAITELAERAVQEAAAVRSAADGGDLDRRAATARDAVTRFSDLAGEQIRP
ncbi:hypothetical protein [Kitasatospora terrestris]|uniref:Protein kilB n=1 Tax=Kitasatospora terrestris TaxID=258051 RepID=A0ABP9DBV5_9ACTN